VTKIKITTTQNIEIEYELATIFDRILAWLLDFAILIVYAFLGVLVGIAFTKEFSMGILAVVAVPFALYHLLMEAFFKGQSVGKMALRIRVVRTDGAPANFGNFLVRWVLRLFETDPVVFYGAIGLGSIAFSFKGQRLGDMMAGTTVIKLDRKVNLHDTFFGHTKEGYVPMFPSTHSLDDEDATTIRDVLHMFRIDRDVNVLKVCANRVCHVLQVTPPKEMTAELFLRHVLRDYANLHSK
jgi:uncharacterized RDD family membrane protein YckC